MSEDPGQYGTPPPMPPCKNCGATNTARLRCLPAAPVRDCATPSWSPHAHYRCPDCWS